MASHFRNLFGGQPHDQNMRPQHHRTHSQQPVYRPSLSRTPSHASSTRSSSSSPRHYQNVDSYTLARDDLHKPRSHHGHSSHLARVIPQLSYTHSNSSSVSSHHSSFAPMPSAGPPFAESRPHLQHAPTWHGPTHMSRSHSHLPQREVAVHPLLSYNHRHPTVSYNALWKPSSSTIIHPATHVSISSHTLGQLATTPPTMELTLTASHFPWPIFVKAAPGSRGITNIDIIYAVYDALRTRAVQHEFESLGYGSRKQQKVSTAFEKRCALTGGGWEKGVRRIDWLGDNTIMLGIEPSSESPGTAKVIFSK